MIERIKAVMVALGTTWILVLMIALSVVSLAITLERAWLYWTLRDDVPGLMRELARLLRAGDLEGARRRLEASPSAEAAVVVAGLVEADYGVDAAEEAMAGASALQRVKLERRLAFLGTLGNNAPFIGLLGTVIGIMASFDELAKARSMTAAVGAAAGQLAPDAVMKNIAEALVATAIGLLVAIPAVAAFNYYNRIVKNTLANTEALSHVLLSHLKSSPEALAAAATAARPSRDPAPSKREPKEGKKEKEKDKDKRPAPEADEAEA